MYRFCNRRSLYSTSSAETRAGNKASRPSSHVDRISAMWPSGGIPETNLLFEGSRNAFSPCSRIPMPFQQPSRWCPAIWRLPCRPMTCHLEALTEYQSPATPLSILSWATRVLAQIEWTYRRSQFNHVQVQFSWYLGKRYRRLGVRCWEAISAVGTTESSSEQWQRKGIRKPLHRPESSAPSRSISEWT